MTNDAQKKLILSLLDYIRTVLRSGLENRHYIADGLLDSVEAIITHDWQMTDKPVSQHTYNK